MTIVGYFASWLIIGTTRTSAGRALLVEQFRILTSQIPVLYGVLIVESASVSYVLPDTLSWLFRFGVTGSLVLISTLRMFYWVRLRKVELTPEDSLQHLAKTRMLASALNAVFSVWTLVLFESV